jgi:hypothetical protein
MTLRTRRVLATLCSASLLAITSACAGDSDGHRDTNGEETGETTVPRTPSVSAGTVVSLDSPRPADVRVHRAGASLALTFVDTSNVYTYTTAWLGGGPEVGIDLATLEAAVGRNLYADSYTAAALDSGELIWLVAPDDGVDAHLGVAVVSAAGADLSVLPSDAIPALASGTLGSEVLVTHHVDGGGSSLRLLHGADVSALSTGGGDLPLSGGGVPAVAGDQVVVVGSALSSAPCASPRALAVTTASLDGGVASTSCVDLGDEIVSLAAESATGDAAGVGIVVWASDGASSGEQFVVVDEGELASGPVELGATGTSAAPSERAVARADDGWGVVTWSDDGACSFTWVPDDGAPASFDLDGVTADEAPSIAATDEGFVVIVVSAGAVMRFDVTLTQD